MSSRVSFKDNIIYQHAEENGLTVDNLKDDLEELLIIQEQLKKQKLPVCLLFDATNAKGADSKVRVQALHNMSQLNYKRVAVIGLQSLFLNQLVKFIVLGIGKQKKIKVFTTKEKAEYWLRTGKFL